MTILGEGNPSFFSFHRVKLAERHPATWWRSPSRSISCGGWIRSFCPSQRRCLSHNGICPNFHWTSTSTLRLEFETMRKAYPGSHSDCLADLPIWRVNLSLWNNVGWREGRKGTKRRKKRGGRGRGGGGRWEGWRTEEEEKESIPVQTAWSPASLLWQTVPILHVFARLAQRLPPPWSPPSSYPLLKTASFPDFLPMVLHTWCCGYLCTCLPRLLAWGEYHKARDPSLPPPGYPTPCLMLSLGGPLLSSRHLLL